MSRSEKWSPQQSHIFIANHIAGSNVVSTNKYKLDERVFQAIRQTAEIKRRVANFYNAPPPRLKISSNVTHRSNSTTLIQTNSQSFFAFEESSKTNEVRTPSVAERGESKRDCSVYDIEKWNGKVEQNQPYRYRNNEEMIIRLAEVEQQLLQLNQTNNILRDKLKLNESESIIPKVGTITHFHSEEVSFNLSDSIEPISDHKAQRKHQDNTKKRQYKSARKFEDTSNECHETQKQIYEEASSTKKLDVSSQWFHDTSKKPYDKFSREKEQAIDMSGDISKRESKNQQKPYISKIQKLTETRGSKKIRQVLVDKDSALDQEKQIDSSSSADKFEATEVEESEEEKKKLVDSRFQPINFLDSHKQRESRGNRSQNKQKKVDKVQPSSPHTSAKQEERRQPHKVDQVQPSSHHTTDKQGERSQKRQAEKLRSDVQLEGELQTNPSGQIDKLKVEKAISTATKSGIQRKYSPCSSPISSSSSPASSLKSHQDAKKGVQESEDDDPRLKSSHLNTDSFGNTSSKQKSTFKVTKIKTPLTINSPTTSPDKQPSTESFKVHFQEQPPHSKSTTLSSRKTSPGQYSSRSLENSQNSSKNQISNKSRFDKSVSDRSNSCDSSSAQKECLCKQSICECKGYRQHRKKVIQEVCDRFSSDQDFSNRSSLSPIRFRIGRKRSPSLTKRNITLSKLQKMQLTNSELLHRGQPVIRPTDVRSKEIS